MVNSIILTKNSMIFVRWAKILCHRIRWLIQNSLHSRLLMVLNRIYSLNVLLVCVI